MAKNVLTDSLSEPLNGATAAKVDINAHDGNLTIDCLPSSEGVLASGTLQYLEKQGQPIRTLAVSSGRATFTLEAGAGARRWFHFPWDSCNEATEWQIHLNPTVLSDIKAHSDGGNVKLDLAGMPVTRLSADTGGGNMSVVLPDRAADLSVTARTGAGNVTVELGHSTAGTNTVDASSGAGNVIVRVPSGIAARIRATSGMGKVLVDPRFGRLETNTYQSPDYDGAANKVDITIKSGAGNASVETSWRVETTVFVARERELERLERFLGAALAGAGQVCFVSGEAGSGKTALVTEFARRAEALHPDLIAAFGQGDAQTGIGDPYLPFREVLGLLAGDDTAQRARSISLENAGRLRTLVSVSARFLAAIAPDLVGLLVPGGSLTMNAVKATADMAGWTGKLAKLAQGPAPAGTGAGGAGLDQSVVFEQYTRFVISLAEEKPLLLVLDDLQWTDPSSIALLFRLGRRIVQSRVLIVGTYRPEEVAREGAGGRHPLQKVIAELKRYRGEIEFSLDATDATDRRRFLDSLLDSEPNALDDGFRAALLRRTDGQALFTVELLHAMQERGDLVRDPAGCWAPGPGLDWDALPARVEGVIAERIERLAGDLRAALTVASVEGEEFTAEVVARVRKEEARTLVRRLSEELQREHRLVRAEGLRQLEARRLALYRFQHNLFQQYLYNGMDPVERAYLHEDVGNALEALYQDQTDEVAAQLARHFEEAGVADKAGAYLRRAGELAGGRYANEEALAYLGRALVLLPEADLAGRYRALLSRQQVYDLLERRDAQSSDLVELERVAQGLGVAEQAEVAAWRARHALYSGASREAAAAAAQAAVERARAAGHAGLEATGQLYCGLALEGREQSRGHLQEAAALAGAAGLVNLKARALSALASLGRARGDVAPDRSQEEERLAHYRRSGDRRGEASALVGLAFVQVDTGDYSGALASAQEALTLAREIGARRAEKFALFVIGLLRYLMGDYAPALEDPEQDRSTDRETADRFHEGLRLYALGLLSRRRTDYGRARDCQEHALRVAREGGYGDLEGEALTALGDLYLDLGAPAAAQAHYEQALSVFHGLEMHAQLIFPVLAGLASADLALGQVTQAQAHIAEVLGYLERGGVLRGTWDPFRIYLVCYRVLRAAVDPRADSMLAEGNRLLQEQAARIPDEALRRSFLETVPENRELAAEFAATRQSP